MADEKTDPKAAGDDEPKSGGKRKAAPAKLSNGAPAASAEPNTVASGAYTPEDVIAAAGRNADLPGEHVADQSVLAQGALVNQPENSFGDDDGSVTVKTKKVEGSDLLEVTEDVEQEFYALGAKRPSTRLIASKGQLLTQAQVDALKAG